MLAELTFSILNACSACGKTGEDGLIPRKETRSSTWPMPTPRLRQYDDEVSSRERSWGPLLFDSAIAVGLLVVALTTGSDIGEFRSEPDALNVFFIVVMTLPLAVRRLYPVAVFVVVVLAWGADRALDYPGTLATLGVVLAFYTIGAELSRKRSWRIGGMAAILIVAFTLFGAAILESVGTAAVFSTIISTVTPLLIGREMHERRQHVDELRERAELAEREREEEARRAVADERVRIARELHDVVAHQMSVMTLQADGARRVADGSDPRVIVALETIRETGHRGLEEMRRMVGLLRTQAESEPPTEPLPGLGDVEPLVAQVRGAGVPVDLMIDGQVRPLPESTELSAYRIIQESLTNAVQHGGPNVTTRVRVEYGESHLDIVVEDDGRGAAAVSGSSPGHGLVGMRERVAVLGGEFSANPKPGGGYRVRARIPVET